MDKAKMQAAIASGIDKLLVSLGMKRDEFAGISDSDILFKLSDCFAKQGSVAASLTALKIANTARELEGACQ